jgi:hypothetical protein
VILSVIGVSTVNSVPPGRRRWRVYTYLCPLYNCWYPSFRLTGKEKQEDGQYKKIYGKNPKTPCRRMLESPDVSEASKAELIRRKRGSDPMDLNSRLNRVIGRLLKINREKGSRFWF